MMRKFGLVVACALAFVVLDAGLAARPRHGQPLEPAPGNRRRHPDAFACPNESTTASGHGTEDPVPADASHRAAQSRGGVGLAGAGAQGRTAQAHHHRRRHVHLDGERNRLDGREAIPVGQFGEFNVLAQGIPTGTSQLVFKAIQTYSRRLGRVVDRGPGQGRARPRAPGTVDHADGARWREHDRNHRGGVGGDDDSGNDVGHELAVDRRADPGGLRRRDQPAGRLAGPTPVRPSPGSARAGDLERSRRVGAGRPKSEWALAMATAAIAARAPGD